MLKFIDTHCHIHEILGDDIGLVPEKWHKAGTHDPDAVIAEAEQSGVSKLVCVGTTLKDSVLAVDFVQDRPNCWASIGIHPHEAKDHMSPSDQRAFIALATRPKVIAVGECGLDYYYEHSPKREQAELLRFQIELALKHNLPMIFHIRDAFADFWQIFDGYKGVRGVVHSFSATQAELDQVLHRGLCVGLNGIMTFAKSNEQLAAARAVPLDRLLLETDAPFLTPAPYRGTICEPKHVRVTADFLANLRGESLEDLAHATTTNAQKLFKI